MTPKIFQMFLQNFPRNSQHWYTILSHTSTFQVLYSLIGQIISLFHKKKQNETKHTHTHKIPSYACK